MPTVKIVPVRDPVTVSLLFNTRHVPIEVRRAISLSLRRRAIAQVVTEDSALAVSSPEGIQADVLSGPIELNLVTSSESSDFQRAALVVQSQLAEHDITTHIAAVPADVLQKLTHTGDYDTLLFFGGWGLRYAQQLESHSPANVTGYANPKFDAAVAARDEAAMLKILAEDVPLTPMFTMNEGVAIDERFCGAHPESGQDYTWLADIHPCAPGER